jgi:hypothetical protein
LELFKFLIFVVSPQNLACGTKKCFLSYRLSAISNLNFPSFCSTMAASHLRFTENYFLNENISV